MTFTLVEANMTGLQHYPVNSAMCRIISEIAGDNSVELFCSDEHFSCLNLGEAVFHKIYHHSLSVLAPGSKRIKKFFLEYFQSRKIIRDSQSDFIVFLSMFPNVQFFLTLFARKIPQKKIIVITHGESEGLEMQGKWKVWSYPFWISLCSKINSPSNFIRIVLGDSIKENFEKYFKGRIFSINHPIGVFISENHIRPNVNKNIFAYIGEFSLKKGGATFMDAAKKIENNSGSKFFVIGSFKLHIDDIPSNIKILSKGGMILQEDFDEAVSSATYACFAYSSSSYKFTASGAVLDAIRFLKPIIYIKNSYFDGIFKDAGNIGWRCEDECEFIETIERIDKNPDEKLYAEQRENLKKLQGRFSTQTVQKQIEKILDTLEEDRL
ncbi:MAG: glycosyltransferase [Bacteroides sp.]|nr:glycosyltransferase [Prevotella sp.]MCM1407369.1 glycosyltransferase [Treponema brennaborense]MCM1469859.1 glycosyltransferase [Bacteroides sp.]